MLVSDRQGGLLPHEGDHPGQTAVAYMASKLFDPNRDVTVTVRRNGRSVATGVKNINLQGHPHLDSFADAMFDQYGIIDSKLAKEAERMIHDGDLAMLRSEAQEKQEEQQLIDAMSREQ